MPTDDASAPSIADGPLQTGVASWLREGFESLSDRLEILFERERDQLPLWLPVGLGVGIGAWFTLGNGREWTAFLLLITAAGLAAMALGSATRWGRALAAFCFVAALGCGLIWMRAEHLASPPLQRAGMVTLTGSVEAVLPVPAQEMTRLIVRPLEGVGPPNRSPIPSRIRINVADDKWNDGVTPGATVRLRAWLMPPAPMAVPGAYDFSRVAFFQRIGGSGRALDLELVSNGGAQGWRGTLAEWRQRLSAHIRSKLEGGAGGIAAALATGDQGGIGQEDADAMRASGLAHLLSVSGLHLTAVVGAVMLLSLRLLALSPWLALRWPLLVVAAGAGALAGLAYTLFTGAEVPTIRSLVAALLILLGITLGREAVTLRLVAVGALIVLLLWPESLAGPSFQLSFAAITAIVALHGHLSIKALLRRRDERLALRLGRGLVGLILTGVAVELALSPIALYHFHKSGLYGAFANILAIPLTTFVIMPAEALALLFDTIGIGRPFWWITGAALKFLLWLAHATASAPGAVATLPAMPVGAYALMIGGGLWVLLWRTEWRRWGAVSLVVGGAWALATPTPDLIITGDGRHLALRAPDGSFAMLRSRAGDYVQDLLTESAGSDQDLRLIENLPGARCNPDLCIADIVRSGRRWRLVATRSSLLIPAPELAEACRSADIAVSERRLPRNCIPRWLKADRWLLRRTGGLAITFGTRPVVTTVAERVGHHPWADFAD